MKTLIINNLNRIFFSAIISSALFLMASLLIPDTYGARTVVYIYKILPEYSFGTIDKNTASVVRAIAYSVNVRSSLASRLNIPGVNQDNIRNALRLTSQFDKNELVVNISAFHTDPKRTAQIADLWSECLIAEYQRLFPTEEKEPIPKLGIKVIAKSEEPKNSSYPNRKAIGLLGFFAGLAFSYLKIRRESKAA